MKAEHLLRHYDQVADSPHAVKRLRSYILDLAVRGKLVAQDPRDGSAAEHLRQVSRARAPHASSLSPTPALTIDALFEIPRGWSWSCVAEIASKTGSGSTPRGGRTAYKPSGIPFLRSQNVHNEGLRLQDVAYIDRKTHEKMAGTAVQGGDLLLNITGGSIGRCCRVPADIGDANVSQHVAIIRPAICEMGHFLHKLFLSPYFQQFVLTEQTGAGRGGLPKNRMDRIPVAIPPLAEQHRIIAKVDELMALCDQLEKARTDREATRDKLTTATLARLNNPNPETFREDARFALENIGALTSRVDQIKPLRQMVLDLAMQGKLVAQHFSHAAVVPAVATTTAHSRRSIEPIVPPYPLPKNWQWRTISTIVELVTDGEHATPPRVVEQEIPLVTAKNVRDGKMDYSQTDWVSVATAEKAWRRCRPTVGDVLLVCVGATTGRVTVLRHPQDMVLVRSVALIRPSAEMDSEYLERAVRSPLLQRQIWGSVKATAQPCLYINRIQSLLVPVPPLEEQCRIVARVDELMMLCDQLEASLAASDDTRSRILNALLAEVLRSDPNIIASESMVSQSSTHATPKRKLAS